jgi:hypothetical protein
VEKAIRAQNMNNGDATPLRFTTPLRFINNMLDEIEERIEMYLGSGEQTVGAVTL